MGYSTPKKQLDLKEFLSQPAKKQQRKTGFANRSKPKPAIRSDEAGAGPAEDSELEESHGEGHAPAQRS